MVHSTPTVGSPAPDFTLPSTAGGEVVLSSYRDRSNVLLAFFPLAFTGVCTAEMCDFSEDYSRFEGVNTVVFGISVDSIPTLKEFKHKHQITVDLLSDFKRDVSRVYGVLMAETFFSMRAYFVIDREGVLRWSCVEDALGHKRDNAELLEQLHEVTGV
jgi:peroxiredoxin